MRRAVRNVADITASRTHRQGCGVGSACFGNMLRQHGTDKSHDIAPDIALVKRPSDKRVHFQRCARCFAYSVQAATGFTHPRMCTVSIAQPYTWHNAVVKSSAWNGCSRHRQSWHSPAFCSRQANPANCTSPTHGHTSTLVILPCKHMLLYNKHNNIS